MEYNMKYLEGGVWNETDNRVVATILPYLVYSFAKPKMVVAEVGVWEGNSLALYIRKIKDLDGKLYLIDWWKGSKHVEEEAEMSFNEDIYEEAYQKVLKIVNENDAQDNVVILKGDSVEMAKQIPDGELDLCFIDAGHTYEECKKDIKAYLPKVKKGGIMAGDDMDGVVSFYTYLVNLGTYTVEELSMDVVDNKGHPGVHAAVWDCFQVNVNTISDGWYTFAGYKIVRAAIGIVDAEADAKFWSKGISSGEYTGQIVPFKGGYHLLTNKHVFLVPEGWTQPSGMHTVTENKTTAWLMK
jgi:hypothetical protein